MKRHAFLIGVEEYTHFNPTPFAHADVDLLYETLTEKCDYATQSVTVFELAPDNAVPPSEILRKVGDAVSGLEEQDSVLVFFAGHGHLEDGAGYLVLPDTHPGAYQTTALPLQDLSKALRRDKRICFRVFDACHSGLDVRAPDQPDSQAFVRSITTDGAGWVTLAACAADEYSIGDPEVGHGLFTYHLCQYIKNAKTGDFIRPEIARAEIAEPVTTRARALGNAQSPTLNASISGIVTLATRLADPPEPESRLGGGGENSTALTARIEALRAVTDMAATEELESSLTQLSDAVFAELKSRSDLLGGVSRGDPTTASFIPNAMGQSIVQFTQKQGFQPRHTHEVVKSEIDEHAGLGALSTLFPRRKRTITDYVVSQASDMPDSAVVLRTSGDGRCVPALEVLAYVIPLQLSVCLLVAAFRKGWPPRESDLIHVFNAYQHQRPSSSKPPADLAAFAINKIVQRVEEAVENRVAQLEREIAEG